MNGGYPEYWDTSTLLKLYAPEADSAWFTAHFAQTLGTLFTSAITLVELACGVQRKIMNGELARSKAAVIEREIAMDCQGSYSVIACTDAVLKRAHQIVQSAAQGTQPAMIRSLDVIHVATAIEAGAKTMVATDVRLREVASRNGLKLVPRS